MVVALLSGCSSSEGESASRQVAKHVLALAETSYAGYVIPRETRKIEVSASLLVVADGEEVTAGQSLTADNVSRRTALQDQLEGYDNRIAVSDEALTKLDRMNINITFKRDSRVRSETVRAAEYDVESAILTHKREESQQERESSDTGNTGVNKSEENSEKKRDNEERKLARQEYVSKLSSLFEKLKTESQNAKQEVAKELDALVVVAPIAGILRIQDDEVRVESRDYSFVYLATESQVDRLTTANNLKFEFRGARVGILKVSSVNYDTEATTDPQFPRYKMILDVELTDSCAPREHSTARMIEVEEQLAVPEDYVGSNEQGNYVIRNGKQIPVEVVKDAEGNNLVPIGELRPGDTIEQVVQS
jgi:hypothetical protein